MGEKSETDKHKGGVCKWNNNKKKEKPDAGTKSNERLEFRGMEGYYAETKEEALKTALDMIPEGSVIGWGGSMSAQEIGLIEKVCQGNYTVYNRDTCKSPEENGKCSLIFSTVISSWQAPMPLQKTGSWLILTE